MSYDIEFVATTIINMATTVTNVKKYLNIFQQKSQKF